MLERHFHRRRLPHLYYNEGVYFVTYRVKNSIAKNYIRELWEDYRLALKDSSLTGYQQKKFFDKYEKALNENIPHCDYLIRPEINKIVKYTIHFPEGKEYNLLAYCIMPNHVHLVFQLLKGNRGISKIMQSIKRISGRDINRVLGEKGHFWQKESYDRLVRDDKELYFTLEYVLNNPVEAGLAAAQEEWDHNFINKNLLY